MYIYILESIEKKIVFYVLYFFLKTFFKSFLFFKVFYFINLDIHIALFILLRET